MREIAITTLSGKLTRDVELRELPSGIEVARLRIASTTRRPRGDELVLNANHFTVEVYGAQARACAEHLGEGSHVVVKAELEWREWTDEQNKRREAVIFRARQVFLNCARPDVSAPDTPASDPRS
jgi:single stranded DNA-binding protein